MSYMSLIPKRFTGTAPQFLPTLRRLFSYFFHPVPRQSHVALLGDCKLFVRTKPPFAMWMKVDPFILIARTSAEVDNDNEIRQEDSFPRTSPSCEVSTA